MMGTNYKVHPQVTLETVAGRHFLIAYGEARGNLPYLREVNETGAYYWQMAEAGTDTEDMLTAAAEVYDALPEILEKGLRFFLRELIDEGYLMVENCGLKES